jgi:RNA polymerase sigma-70 factor (ECF subfamily)
MDRPGITTTSGPPDARKSATSKQDPFSVTAWTVVMAALGSSQGAKEAIEELCRTYWHPVYCYIRHRGYTPHDAEDLTQEFFFQVVHRKRLRSPDRTKGKFRAYLLAAVKGLLANDWQARHAAKRGGRVVISSLDALSAEAVFAAAPMSDHSPESAFDRHWAATTLARVYKALREEFRSSGREAIYDELEAVLRSPADKPDYAALAEKFGMRGNALAVAAHRLRRRF